MTNYTVTTTYPTKKKQVVLEPMVFRGCLMVAVLSAIYFILKFVANNIGVSFVQIEANIVEWGLPFIQCLLATAILFVPTLVTKIIKIKLPDSLSAFFYIFVVASTILGEAFTFYYKIPYWDSLLHFSSGIMAGMFGGILLVSFWQKKKCENLISPVVIVISFICFAMCVGVVWEIFEFAIDSLFGVNMQKWMLQDGTSLVGQAALVDTMKDLIVDLAGAMVATISACSSLKQKKGWFYQGLKDRSIKD